MTDLRRRMREDLQLAGYSSRTIDSYIATVRVLAKYYNRSPDLLTEEELRQFFAHLINDLRSSGSSVTVYPNKVYAVAPLRYAPHKLYLVNR